MDKRLYGSLITTVALVIGTTPGCVNASPALDVGDPGFPFGPTTLEVRPLAYTQDIKPLFDRDCARCHSAFDARGGYSVSTYRDVMQGQHPGDAKSSVVRDCSPGGSMFPYFSGDAVTEATAVFRWMVYYDAAQNR